MEDNKTIQQVIVSMTSFPAAIQYAAKAVKSLLDGSVLPDKVVLYLTFSQFGEEGVPQELVSLAESNPVLKSAIMTATYALIVSLYRRCATFPTPSS